MSYKACDSLRSSFSLQKNRTNKSLEQIREDRYSPQRMLMLSAS
nr:MAG TPA: hypothetical protein [Ackermannviridae sp.]